MLKIVIIYRTVAHCRVCRIVIILAARLDEDNLQDAEDSAIMHNFPHLKPIEVFLVAQVLAVAIVLSSLCHVV